MEKAAVIDMDGVLADFEWAFCQEFGHNKREVIGLEERYPNRRAEIEEFVNDPLTYAFLKPLSTGYHIARWCRNNGFEIHIVSSRPSTTQFFEVTGQWLVHHEIPFDYISLGPNKKERIIKKAPIFLVDDFFDICYMWSVRYQRRSILISWPWNMLMHIKNEHPRKDFLLRAGPCRLVVHDLMERLLADINLQA